MRAHPALIAFALVVSCARAPAVAPGEPGHAQGARHESAPSNVLRSDYVGSAACSACHAKETEAWARSPMHRMTRNADVADVKAPFDGRAMRFKGDSVSLESRGAARFVRIARDASLGELYRVTRIVGGRTREDFVGVRVKSEDDSRAVSDEMVLPVSYLIFSGALRYKGYSVLVHERDSAHAGPVWSETCLFCHNTVPFFSTVLGALAGPRAPAYQGEDLAPLLPEDRRWTWSVGDEHALAAAVDDELAHLRSGAPPSDDSPQTVLRTAIAATRSSFGGSDLVEVGIGCESCHGGARMHVRDPKTPPSVVPFGPMLAMSPPKAKTPEAAHAQEINRVCARCHQVLFSRYPWTWEGGRRTSNDRGGSPINSGEARDFLLGGCASAMACTTCHDPHDAKDRAEKDDALATPAGNAPCTRCHATYATDAALRAHAHHDPRGPGGACVACHMPRKNMGLDLRLTRYHRIGSPTDPERVLRDRPLECALCHQEKSTESLARTMESWWGKAYPRDLLERLYGELSEPNLAATLERGKPHEVAVAAAALGERHQRADGSAIARGLVNEYPLVRMFAARALTQAIGKDCGIDVNGADVAHIEAAAAACLGSAGLSVPAWAPPGPARPGDSEPVDD